MHQHHQYNMQMYIDVHVSFPSLSYEAVVEFSGCMLSSSILLKVFYFRPIFFVLLFCQMKRFKFYFVCDLMRFGSSKHFIVSQQQHVTLSFREIIIFFSQQSGGIDPVQMCSWKGLCPVHVRVQ